MIDASIKNNGYIAWERFIKEGKINEKEIRPIIAESWIRSKQFGVDPFLTEGIVVPEIIIEDKIKKNKSLLEISRPFMRTLYEFVAGSGFLVILYDQDGITLEMIGDQEVKFLSEAHNLKVGSDLSEEKMGTNAPGVVFVQKKPVQVIAEEHYCRIFHKWACSAAPILNDEGKLLGVLNVTGNYKKVYPHTLGMVVAAAKAIENEIKLVEAYNKLSVAYEYSNKIMESVSEGLFSIDKNGNITQINSIAKKILTYEDKKSNIFFYPSLHKVNNVLATGAVIANEEISIKNEGRFMFSALPIKGVTKDISGAVVSLKEIEHVHKFAANIFGADAKFSFNDLIGKSNKFLEAVNLAKSASQSDSIVLLQGESGTGKDLFAQAIHNSSKRKNKPFIAINCAAIPHELVGSELFGYEEGAFTGAKKGGRIGKFELADKGTLFLDEIGDMPLDLQAHLLRVLEEKKITRLGGHKAIPIDVRVIVATNKNLKELVRKKSFREDLYYRLNVLTIILPSLRERENDIMLLTKYFINKLNKRLNKSINRLDDEITEIFKKYKWPGNIRELQNLLEKAMHLADKELILKKEHFPDLVFEELKDVSGNNKTKTIVNYEKEIILLTLKKYNGNITKASRELGIARNTLYNKIKKLGINRSNI